MIVIAHAGHYALGLVEFAPLLVVVAFAIWKSRSGRGHARPDAGTPQPHDRMGATGSHA